MRSRKFQNIYIRIYLRFKSFILVPDDDPCGPKYVAFIDIIEEFVVFDGDIYPMMSLEFFVDIILPAPL